MGRERVLLHLPVADSTVLAAAGANADLFGLLATVRLSASPVVTRDEGVPRCVTRHGTRQRRKPRPELVAHSQARQARALMSPPPARM